MDNDRPPRGREFYCSREFYSRPRYQRDAGWPHENPSRFPREPIPNVPLVRPSFARSSMTCVPGPAPRCGPPYPFYDTYSVPVPRGGCRGPPPEFVAAGPYHGYPQFGPSPRFHPGRPPPHYPQPPPRFLARTAAGPCFRERQPRPFPDYSPMPFPPPRMPVFPGFGHPSANAFDGTSRMPYRSCHNFALSPSNTGNARPVDISKCSAEELINMRKYGEAAQKIMKQNRTAEFPLDWFVVPLLCCGKAHLLEQYVLHAPELQKKLLEIVMLLFGQQSVVNRLMQDNRDICVPRHCDLNQKSIKKWAITWVTKFDLDRSLVREVHVERCHSALNWMMKGSSFEDISEAAWLETVAAMTDPFADNLRPFCLNLLSRSTQNAFVLGKLMLHWEIPLWKGKSAEEILSTALNVFPVEKPNEIHRLTLPRDSIVMVDTAVTFRSAVGTIAEASVIGIDCEWYSNPADLEATKLALMQIAIEKECYLLDMQALLRISNEVEWDLLGNVFSNKDITKLGFGLSADLRMLYDSVPALDAAIKKAQFVDIKQLAEKMHKLIPDLFGVSEPLPPENPPDGPQPVKKLPAVKFSLSSIVEKLFGFPLCKLECRSNWERRPLREAQILYAALDAYCLLEVYRKLEEICIEKGLPFPPEGIQEKGGPSKKAEKRLQRWMDKKQRDSGNRVDGVTQEGRENKPEDDSVPADDAPADVKTTKINSPSRRNEKTRKWVEKKKRNRVQNVAVAYQEVESSHGTENAGLPENALSRDNATQDCG